jgi:hypothetical protein
MKPSEVAIPERMKYLPLDPRGYPIFYIAQITPDGKPLFTVNDSLKQREVAEKDLCEICGTKLFRGRWFIGGPLSAFAPNGAYNDAPMHDDCAHYALNVCPWLAAPNYGKAIAEHQVKDIPGMLTNDPSDPLMKYRPPLFVALMCIGNDKKVMPEGHYHFIPKRPYRKVEFWMHGKELPEDSGRQITEGYMTAYAGRRRA